MTSEPPLCYLRNFYGSAFLTSGMKEASFLQRVVTLLEVCTSTERREFPKTILPPSILVGPCPRVFILANPASPRPNCFRFLQIMPGELLSADVPSLGYTCTRLGYTCTWWVGRSWWAWDFDWIENRARSPYFSTDGGQGWGVTSLYHQRGPGKILFTASHDITQRIWDLEDNESKYQ